MLSSPTASPLDAPQASGAQRKASSPDSNIAMDAALAERFPPFSVPELLNKPFEEEIRRDDEFKEQLHQQLLELVLEFHAWSTSRPDSESTSAGQALFDETRVIQRLEEEQGMWSILFEQSRLRLVEFISRIKSALAALTGFGL